MKKFAKVAVVLLMVVVLGACQNKEKETTKNAEKKVEQTTKKKKTETSKTSETQSSQAAAVTQPSTQPQPTQNQTAGNPQQPVNNQQAVNTPTNAGTTPVQPAPAVTEPVAPAEDQSQVGVYSREECAHIARMTISMSGADESQFTEDQLYNYYDQCAQLGADYSYLLGLVAQDTGLNKEELVANYDQVQAASDDGSGNQ